MLIRDDVCILFYIKIWFENFAVHCDVIVSCVVKRKYCSITQKKNMVSFCNDLKPRPFIQMLFLTSITEKTTTKKQLLSLASLLTLLIPPTTDICVQKCKFAYDDCHLGDIISVENIQPEKWNTQSANMTTTCCENDSPYVLNYWFRYLFFLPNGGQIKLFLFSCREIHVQSQVQVYFWQNLLDKNQLSYEHIQCIIFLCYEEELEQKFFSRRSISATCESFLYFSVIVR